MDGVDIVMTSNLEYLGEWLVELDQSNLLD